ncbi:MAG: leucine-rich repeat domain-containing protein, partial [archaeon]|nr:leucine-rich repeat domain-containing protein [archaeon]
MVTELNEYGLPEEETLVLKEFERITGKTLPKVDRVMWVQKTSKKGINTSKHQLGFMIEDGHIIGLGLCPRVHGSVVNPYFQLSFIPESIRKLKKLRILDLSSNGLTLFSGVTPIGGESNPGLNLLPDWFGNLTTLEELNLSWNKLTSLPESFGNLKNLKILHLYKNKIRKLPESIGNLKKLQEIYLSQNELTTLPNTFCDLRSLQEIDLQRNK